MKDQLLFYQLFEAQSSTYTYLLADALTSEALIIDPVLDTLERDLKLIHELDLKLLYVLDTHVHADHITAAGELRAKTGAKSGISSRAQVNCADLLLKDHDVLPFGQFKLEVLETPGHTDSCLTFKVNDLLFTGDTLLIRGTGRTDFQQGSASAMYDSIQKILALPEHYTIYPAHDYKGQTKSTVGLEKQFNPRVGANKSKNDFIELMSQLKLDLPKKIHEAVPANKACGKKLDS